MTDLGVVICRTGESDGTEHDGTGDSFFNGENKSKSSKLTRSTSLISGAGGGGGGIRTAGLDTLGGDFVSLTVRLRFCGGVCDDDTDGERDRCCFRVLFVTDEVTISIGSASSTTHRFSCTLVRSYSASDTKGVSFDFFFFKGD